MGVFEVDGFKPVIGEGTYVDEAASVIGNVVIGCKCFIAPGARIRGDFGRIEIGDGTSIADNCVLHVRPGEITRIGSHVTIAHNCVLDSCTVLDHAVIGIGAVITNWSIIGRWSVVAEGALVRNGFEVPDERIAVGVPARLLDVSVSEHYKEDWLHFNEMCMRLASQVYPQTLKKIS